MSWMKTIVSRLSPKKLSSRHTILRSPAKCPDPVEDMLRLALLAESVAQTAYLEEARAQTALLAFQTGRMVTGHLEEADPNADPGSVTVVDDLENDTRTYTKTYLNGCSVKHIIHGIPDVPIDQEEGS